MDFKNGTLINYQDCIICNKNIKNSSLLVTINKALFSKYNQLQEENYMNSINNILNKEKTIDYLNFYENEQFIKEENFLKRFYLRKEFIKKFENLMKFHQLNINQPITFIDKDTKPIIKYFKLKKKIQEKAIKNLLEALSDSELEKMNFNLEDYENIKSIIEEKNEKNSKFLLHGSVWDKTLMNKKYLFDFSNSYNIKKKKFPFIKKKESQVLINYWLKNKITEKKFPSFLDILSKNTIKNEFKLKKKKNLNINKWNFKKKKIKPEICLPDKYQVKSPRKIKKKSPKKIKKKSQKIIIPNINTLKLSKIDKDFKKRHKDNLFSDNRFTKVIGKSNENYKLCLSSRYNPKLKKIASNTNFQTKNNKKITKIVKNFLKSPTNKKLINNSIKNSKRKTSSGRNDINLNIRKFSKNKKKLDAYKIERSSDSKKINSKSNKIKNKSKTKKSKNPFNNKILRKDSWEKLINKNKKKIKSRNILKTNKMKATINKN